MEETKKNKMGGGDLVASAANGDAKVIKKPEWKEALGNVHKLELAKGAVRLVVEWDSTRGEGYRVSCNGLRLKGVFAELSGAKQEAVQFVRRMMTMALAELMS